MEFDNHTTREAINILALADNVQLNIINGNFLNEDAWDTGAGWAIDTNLNIAAYSGTGGGTLRQSFETLIPGLIYSVTYTIVAIDQTICEVFLGSQLGASRQDTGTFTDIFTAGISNTGLEFLPRAPIANSVLQIADVSIAPGYETEVIDTNGFQSLEFIVQTGERCGGFESLIEESDTDIVGSYTDVPIEEIIGETISFADGETEVIKHIGTVGKKRFQHFKILNAKGENVITAYAVLKKSVSKADA